MTSQSTGPPTWYYEAVGRLVVAATQLETELHLLARIIAGVEDEDFGAALDDMDSNFRAYDAVKAVKGQISENATRGLVDDALEEAGDLLKERNRAAHSVVVADGSGGFEREDVRTNERTPIDGELRATMDDAAACLQALSAKMQRQVHASARRDVGRRAKRQET